MLLKQSEIYQEINAVSNKLQVSLEQLCLKHKFSENSMPTAEQKMSFTIIGELGAIIDLIETMKKEQPTEDMITILKEMITEGESLNGRIQLYATVVQPETVN